MSVLVFIVTFADNSDQDCCIVGSTAHTDRNTAIRNAIEMYKNDFDGVCLDVDMDEVYDVLREDDWGDRIDDQHTVNKTTFVVRDVMLQIE